MATRMSQDRATQFIVQLVRDKVPFGVTFHDNYVYIEDHDPTPEQLRPVLCEAEGAE